MKIEAARKLIQEAQVRASKSDETVADLCEGRNDWRMSVPARPDSDPDLIIAASLRDVDALADLAEGLLEENERLKAELGCREALIKDHLAKTLHLENRVDAESFRAEAAEVKLSKAQKVVEAFDAMVIVTPHGQPCYATSRGIPQGMPPKIERKVRAALAAYEAEK